MTHHSTANPLPGVPRGRYGAQMAVVCAGAIAVAWVFTSVMGGDQRSALLAAVCVAAASVATFLPVLFGGRAARGVSGFGVMVLVASMLRILLLLGLALFFDKTLELARREYWIGILAGGGVVLVVETALAVTLLNRLERQKTSGPVARPPTINGTEQADACSAH